MSKRIKKTKHLKELISTMICCFIIILVIVCNYKEEKIELKNNHMTVAANSETSKKGYRYLSDVEYVKEQSSVGWGNITLDGNLETQYNGGLITLIINGKERSFLKGVTAHATSTMVYDISGLDYDKFSTYYGVDASRKANGNGVKFAIYTSVDGINWELHTPVSPGVQKGDTEARYIELDVRGKKYLKLYCNNNGNDTADHCTYGNAMFYNEGQKPTEDNNPYDFIKTIEEYDEILKNSSLEEITGSKEQIVLQRKFVSSIGYDMLQNIAHLDETRKETIEWLMTDLEALRYYVTGGRPTGNYINSLNVLVKLYTTYKDDLKDTTTTQYTVLGNLYKRMMISLSLTHSTNVCLWIGGNQCSDAITRYAIYKKMRAENLLENKVFETLNIEEMRWVMNNNIDDEEIEWLNHHIRRYNKNIDPYQYIVYRFGYNYNLPQYYDATKYDQWDQKYHLSQYNITYQVGKPKLWIVFEQGSVCGGLSKTGSNINGSLGNPSAVIGQPGHAAYLEYVETADGQGMWGLKNDVSGWTKSEKSERLLCGWGSNNWDSYYQVSYVPYAQEALNDIDNYNKALETMLMADLYQNDIEKLEEIYRKALEIQSINMDAWYGLIRTYQRDTNKTAEDYIELAKELTEELYYYPLPMWDLMKLIKGNLQNTNYYATYTNYIRTSLEKGKALGSDAPINQPSITRTMASYLLGQDDYSIANFSFDGERKNEIVLGSKYEGNGVRWDYSLDGGVTWKATSESSVLLSQEEIESITEENDIKIHIVGVNYNAENIYTINITKSATPTHLFGNDLENRVIGINLTYEWRRSESDAWTSYRDASPDNTGNKTLQVRIGATGTRLPSDAQEFSFTEDNQPNTRKYVSISHLSIHSVSTQATAQGRPATNAIDGNYNTNWHSAWNGTDTQRFITIKLDKPRYVSAVEFVPGGGGNGKILDGTVYGSVDGENWIELSKLQNLRYTNQANTNEDAMKNIKNFEIADPQEVQYIKIVANRASNGNWFTARAFNIYQDLTKNPRPTAGVGYSITTTTNQDVVARLINPSTNITITNNGGSDTYTFKENGEFTFEFVDEFGTKGTSTARVDWIDKVAPTATFEYSTTSKTNEEVVVRLVPSEEVTVLNNGEVDIENPSANPFTYTFTANGEFTFEFRDKAGNIGHATAKVDWIDTELPEATLNYSTMDLTNKDVTVTIAFNEENVTILNNNGSNTYTFKENGEFIFKFMDEAGNVNTKTVKVTWINKKLPPVTLSYSITSMTTGPVSVTLNCDEKITITNNNGQSIYTFKENGEFVFEFVDKLGNKGSITARVDWIKKEEKPVTPEQPVNPVIPNNPSKPTIPSTPNTQAPSQNNRPNDSINNIVDNKEPVLKDFLVKDVLITVNTNNLEENSVLKKNTLSLTQSQIQRFGKNSESFELYFEKDKVKNNLTEESVKMFINLNSKKTFLGIYRIDGDKIELLPYELVSENQIKVDTTGLTKYILAYDEQKTEEIIPPVVNDKTETPKPKANYSFIWVIIGSGGIALILCIVLILLLNNKREEKHYQVRYAE